MIITIFNSRITVVLDGHPNPYTQDTKSVVPVVQRRRVGVRVFYLDVDWS